MTFQGTRHRRLRRGLALFGGLALFAAACGNDDDDAETAPADDDGEEAPADDLPDSVTIGIANEVPFGFEEGGEATGEAPELAKEVFDRLGIEVSDFTTTEFDGLIGGLTADRFDVIAAGMFITPERAENILFSNPDYCASFALGVPAGNPNDLADFQSVVDNPDVTLGVLSGAVEGQLAQDAGVPGGQIEELPEVADLFDALGAGRIDAVALTRVTVDAQAEELDDVDATEPFLPEIDGEEQPAGCGGFGFSLDDEALRDAFNEELAAMHEAGEVLPIIEPFGFTEDEVTSAAETTADELSGAGGS